MKRKLSIDQHVIQFCRFLRDNGFAVGPTEEVDVLNALTMIDWADRLQFKAVLKTVLVKNISQFHLFDELYTKYWWELKRAQDSKLKDSQEADQPSKAKQQAPAIEVIKNWLHGNPQNEIKEVAQYSPGMAKGKADLSAFAEEESREWSHIIRILKRQLENQPNRRLVHNKKPGQLSLRPLVRQNMRKGGELLDLYFKHPKKQKLKLVLLCDVSKSMDLYARFIIQMMYAFQNSGLQMETFAFSTSLYRATRLLKSQSIKKALNALSDHVEEWGSGTRIGDCLFEFVDRYGRSLLDKKTYVFIMSDGWDNGNVELMGRAMKKIKSASKKVIWLNPLASSESFAPEVQGLKAALPYIDALVPATQIGDLKYVLKK